MKKKDFIADVMHEIDMLKKHATKAELNNLDFDMFDYDHQDNCIYGQITGSCASPRAKILMDKACIRVMNIKSERYLTGAKLLAGKTFSKIKHQINRDNTSQTWNESGRRNYSHLSALEGYITLKGAKNKQIIQYLRGEIDTLKL